MAHETPTTTVSLFDTFSFPSPPAFTHPEVTLKITILPHLWDVAHAGQTDIHHLHPSLPASRFLLKESFPLRFTQARSHLTQGALPIAPSQGKCSCMCSHCTLSWYSSRSVTDILCWILTLWWESPTLIHLYILCRVPGTEQTLNMCVLHT